MINKNELVIFEADGNAIKLDIPIGKETVLLNRQQMAKLFVKDIKTIGKHINNALREELDESADANFATVQTEGNRKVEHNIPYYNPDVIISVRHRVKSKHGIEFRKWANPILKQYILQGYALIIIVSHN